MDTSFDLVSRDGLPDALRVLLDDYPRDLWASDPGFHGLVSFWLERHMGFRRLLAAMTEETEVLLDKGDPQRFMQRISRYGSIFVNDLHGHHQIEDHHYFPLLTERDSRLTRGFDILDKDHHALDGLLQDFVSAANEALTAQGATDPTARFHGNLTRLDRLICRHLDDEEDLIVPVILKYGTAGLD
jgi:hemerythrin-like domain-containing protein